MVICEFCEEEFIPNFKEQRFCSRGCGARWRIKAGIPAVLQPRINRPCLECGNVLIVKARSKRKFCDKSCSSKYYFKIPEYRAKVLTSQFLAQTPFVIGHTPWLKGIKLSYDPFKNYRGGNGRPLTAPQQVLLDTLGNKWKAEHAISLGGRIPNYPTSYKVDLALVERRIAIEIDGNTHGSPASRDKDKKKDTKLRELGWVVWRISNSRALSLVSKTSEDILNIMLSECPP